jgi:hypothetical protein
MASRDMLQRLYLIQELDVSVLAVEAGLAERQGSRPYHPRHFVFLLLLSTGLERLMKIVLQLHALETTGVFLSQRELKEKYGHNLIELRKHVVEKCFTTDYLTRQVAVDDRDFVRDDPLFKDLLQLLSDFAENDRYLYMNGISDPNMGREWPARRWEALESATMPSNERMKLYATGEEDIAKGRANHALVVCLERFVRALARLFTLGPLGGQGRQVSTALVHYRSLLDEDLGSKVYS